MPSGPVTQEQGLDRDDPPLPRDDGRRADHRCMAAGWLARAPRAAALRPGGPSATLAWVIVQGVFGTYTVTMKLYPAIVTAAPARRHGAAGAAGRCRHESLPRPAARRRRALRAGAGGVLALLALQIALGGWVSTNYAVLACTGFPACNGQWWPAMDSRMASRCCANSGARPRAATCRSRRWSRSTWRTASRAALVLAALLLRWRGACAAAGRGRALRRFGVALVAAGRAAAGQRAVQRRARLAARRRAGAHRRRRCAGACC